MDKRVRINPEDPKYISQESSLDIFHSTANLQNDITELDLSLE